VTVTLPKGNDGLGAYQVGNTKVFIRQPKALFALEELRKAKLPAIVQTMQRCARKYIFRMKCYNMVALHEAIHTAWLAMLQHVKDRRARRAVDDTGAEVAPGADLPDKVRSRALAQSEEQRWRDASKCLPGDTRFHKAIEQAKTDMHAAFVQGHIRAAVSKTRSLAQYRHTDTQAHRHAPCMRPACALHAPSHTHTHRTDRISTLVFGELVQQ
jgi:hypothetical protein